MPCPINHQPDPFGEIVTIAAQEKVEREERYNRTLAYDSLTVRFIPS